MLRFLRLVIETAQSIISHKFQNLRHTMKVKVVIHEAEEGGYWAEVPALPGCFSQGDTLEEITSNVKEAIEAHLLSAQDTSGPTGGKDRVLEIAV